MRYLLLFFLLSIVSPVWGATDWTADGDCRLAYKFEEASGEPSTECGTLSPTTANMGYSATGQVDNAFDFNGTTSEIDLTSDIGDFTSDTAVTIAAWIYMDTDDGTRYPIFGYADTDSASYQYLYLFYVDMRTDDRLEYFCKDTSTILNVGSQTLSTTTWYHVAVTASASGNALWVDGVDITESYATGSSSTDCQFPDVYNAAVDNLYVGYMDWYSTGDDTSFNGKIDELIYLAQELTESEIDGIIANGIDGAEGGGGGGSSRRILLSQKKEWLNCKWHLNEYDGTQYTPDQCSDLIYS